MCDSMASFSHPQAPLNHTTVADSLKNAIAGGNDRIDSLRYLYRSESSLWSNERLKLCYRIHNNKYTTKRLEKLNGLRESGFTAELQNHKDTISTQEQEISSLRAKLQLLDDEMEANRCFTKHQVEKLEAAVLEEKRKGSEFRDQIRKMSLESNKSASQQRNCQMRLDLVNRQIQQRDEFIMRLRKDKDVLAQKLRETSAELREKSKEDEDQNLSIQLEKLERDHEDLVRKEQALKTTVKDMEKVKEQLVKTAQQLETEYREKSLLARIEELERENRTLEVLLKDTRKTRRGREQKPTELKWKHNSTTNFEHLIHPN